MKRARAKELNRLIAAKGLSSARLAELAGFGLSTIQHFRAGRAMPERTWRLLQAVLAAYDGDHTMNNKRISKAIQTSTRPA